MTCPPQAEFVSKYGQKLNALGGDWTAVLFRGGAAIATKNVELGFLASFLSWRFSKKARFGERGMKHE